VITIPLSKGYIAIIDDKDYVKLNKYKWHVLEGKNGVNYATAKIKIDGIRTSVRMHRVVMGLKHFDVSQIDHINHNGLDNRRENLRMCSKHQNNMNRRPNKNRTSRYKGLTLQKTTGKWISRISIDGKYLNLGTYKEETVAALKYDKAALKHYGEYANLNFHSKGDYDY
jgi:hypothetical protein